MSEERRAPQKLTSWKEIADYLHISVRTAQTWERGKGLPVQRMAGKKARVSADPEELGRWEQSVSHSNHWFSNLAFLKTYTALATALLIAAATYESIHYWGQSRQAPPASIHLKGVTSAIPGRHGNGRSRTTLPETVIQTGASDTVSALRRKITFADIDNDGELETILDYSPVELQSSPDQHNRSANCREESQGLRPAPASSASNQELPRTSKIESSAVFGSIRSFKGRGLLLGCQLPNGYKALSPATPRARMKAATSHPPHQNGPVTGRAQPHCAHCEQKPSFPEQHLRS